MKRLLIVSGFLFIFLVLLLPPVFAATEEETLEYARERLQPYAVQERDETPQSVGESICKYISDIDFLGGLTDLVCPGKQTHDIFAPYVLTGHDQDDSLSQLQEEYEELSKLNAVLDDVAGTSSAEVLSSQDNFLTRLLTLDGLFVDKQTAITTRHIWPESQDLGTDARKAISEKMVPALLPLALRERQLAQTATPTNPPGRPPGHAYEKPPGNGVQPPPSGAQWGNCSYGSGYCSVENLQKYFPTLGSAQRASIICQRESGSNPAAANKGCLTGESVDYSIGLFQINLLAHCAPEAFNYSWNPPWCEILDQSLVDKCDKNGGKEDLSIPENNIEKAVQISSNGTVCTAWSAAGSANCNVPPGSDPLLPDAEEEEEEKIIVQIADCPPASSSLRVPGTKYQMLNHASNPDFNCIVPNRLVIHWSGAWNNAQATFDTLNLRDRSCQFAVDQNESLQMLQFFPNVVQKGWCAGGVYNDDSINFEITGAYFDDYFNDTASSRYSQLLEETRKTVELACWAINQYNLDISAVNGHYQLQTGKSDPGVEYLKYIKEEIKRSCQ
jgi:hypothetical protein